MPLLMPLLMPLPSRPARPPDPDSSHCPLTSVASERTGLVCPV